ncbi:MAG TPA: ABC transporter permease [Bacteroidales bacterium]|nr:MAG: ABC transporter permease [Bacteroidetes bacterium GWE2_42_24]OFY29299.1 MAG: ABC transporter permease [Bacteroidetes bacterium GWF2_43_11]PKP27813.1 MAG: ABC transporter permease [Bacteroidetes bacterium HGW-Bacteroidetes-22]HBZ66707.1 ABC transporter permease [Bacteroidales bacterium]
MKENLWKWLGGILILYSIFAGLLIRVPDLPVIHESIRNLFYHVCMWFAMIVVMAVSFVNSLRFLRTFNLRYDTLAAEAARTGLLFGFLGILTGMVWARFTWGDFWVKDPQLNGAAVTILIYLAYLVLRSSIDEEQKRARISAVYAIFAFVLLIVFIGILPRLSEGSIHPGKGGNPGLGVNGLDSTMRLVFYPAIAGWVITGIIIWRIRVRLVQLKSRIDELND